MQQKVLIALIAVVVVGGFAYWAIALRGADQGPVVSQSPVTSGEGAPEGSIHNLPAEPAAEAARADLAAKLGVAPSAVTILMVEERTWSDGCLGLGGPAESCIQMLVDGFRVELLAQGETHVYRTDKTGANLRAE